jgi:hypothetical protein
MHTPRSATALGNTPQISTALMLMSNLSTTGIGGSEALTPVGEGAVSDLGRDDRVPGVAITWPPAVQSDELG